MLHRNLVCHCTTVYWDSKTKKLTYCPYYGLTEKVIDINIERGIKICTACRKTWMAVTWVGELRGMNSVIKEWEE